MYIDVNLLSAFSCRLEKTLTRMPKEKKAPPPRRGKNISFPPAAPKDGNILGKRNKISKEAGRLHPGKRRSALTAEKNDLLRTA